MSPRNHRPDTTCWCNPTPIPIERTSGADAVPLYVHPDPRNEESPDDFRWVVDQMTARVRDTGHPCHVLPAPDTRS